MQYLGIREKFILVGSEPNNARMSYLAGIMESTAKEGFNSHQGRDSNIGIIEAESKDNIIDISNNYDSHRSAGEYGQNYSSVG